MLGTQTASGTPRPAEGPVRANDTARFPATLCRACQQWENATEDVYCSFCGTLLLALELDTSALTLISTLAPTKEVTFRNASSRPMEAIVVQASGNRLPRIFVDPTGTFDIPANGQVRVRFTLDSTQVPPHFPEQRLDYVCVVDNDQRKQRRLQITARSGPSPKLVPPQIDFGSVAAGDAVRQTLEIVNQGGTPLRVTKVEVTGSTELRLAEPFAEIVLAPAQSASMVVVWDSSTGITPAATSTGETGVRVHFGNYPEAAFVPAQARVFRYLLTATPDTVRFPRALSKRDHIQHIRLENRGTIDVEILAIESDVPWLWVIARSAAFTLLCNESSQQRHGVLPPTTFANTFDFKAVCRPAELPAGRHRGSVTIRAHGQRPLVVPVEIDVVHPQPYPDYIGIDFGTTNSVVAVLSRKHEVQLVRDELSHSHLIPSVLVFDDPESWKIGQAAKNEAPTAPERTVRSIKRIMGYEHARRFFDRPFTAGELASRIIRKLVELAEQTLYQETGTYYSVGKAIITVPANFFDLQIREVLDACREAGLDVEEEKTRIAAERTREKIGRAVNAGVILDEPSAAVFYYINHLLKHQNGSAVAQAIGSERGLNLLVFDYGGGTLDISIASIGRDAAETGLRILANVGDNGIGGDSIDLVLMKELLRRCAEKSADQELDASLIETNYRELELRRDREGWSAAVWSEILRVRGDWKELAEAAKLKLGAEAQIDIDIRPDLIVRLADGKIRSAARARRFSVKRSVLHDLLQPFLKKCTQLIDAALELAHVGAADVDYILHTGRQSLLPVIRQHVRDHFSHLAADRDILDEQHLKVCVAKGAALYGSMRNRLVGKGSRIHFFDEGRSLPHSYGVETWRTPVEPEIDVVIPRGARYPTAETRHYDAEMIPDSGTLNLRFYQNTGTSTAIVNNPQATLIGEISIDTIADGKAGCDVHFAIGANRTLEVFADDTAVPIQRAMLQDEEGWMG